MVDIQDPDHQRVAGQFENNADPQLDFSADTQTVDKRFDGSGNHSIRRFRCHARLEQWWRNALRTLVTKLLKYSAWGFGAEKCVVLNNLTVVPLFLDSMAGYAVI